MSIKIVSGNSVAATNDTLKPFKPEGESPQFVKAYKTKIAQIEEGLDQKTQLKKALKGTREVKPRPGSHTEYIKEGTTVRVFQFEFTTDKGNKISLVRREGLTAASNVWMISVDGEKAVPIPGTYWEKMARAAKKVSATAGKPTVLNRYTATLTGLLEHLQKAGFKAVWDKDTVAIKVQGQAAPIKKEILALPDTSVKKVGTRDDIEVIVLEGTPLQINYTRSGFSLIFISKLSGT